MTATEHSGHTEQTNVLWRAAAGPVDLIALGWSLSIFFAVSVLLCVAAGYVLPYFIVHLLAAVLPAFDWRDPQIIAVATVFAFACGWYTALLAGGLYNLFRPKR